MNTVKEKQNLLSRCKHTAGPMSSTRVKGVKGNRYSRNSKILMENLFKKIRNREEKNNKTGGKRKGTYTTEPTH